jgi:type I restriction-modification system DNA methylase subunit
MNLLGSSLLQKQLGAFFTPSHYVEISTKYVRDAITRSKQLGYKDYLIIDRCAGTGNLERFLTPEELSHCILNTIDYTE